MEFVELVIRIPEERYNFIKSSHKDFFDVSINRMLYNQVRLGTLLSKDHDKLIDTEELKAALNKDFLRNERDMDYDVNPAEALEECFDIIDDIEPAVEPTNKSYFKAYEEGLTNESN